MGQKDVFAKAKKVSAWYIPKLNIKDCSRSPAIVACRLSHCDPTEAADLEMPTKAPKLVLNGF